MKRSRLRSLKSPVLIGFEATGNYHRPLAYFLHGQGFELRLISTLALARTREAMHNSWDKNDPKDAQVILHLLKTGLAQTWHDPVVNGVNDVQELSKTHFQVTLARVMCGTRCATTTSRSTSRRLIASFVLTIAFGWYSCWPAFRRPPRLLP